jgi:WD40 repeat protein
VRAIFFLSFRKRITWFLLFLYVLTVSLWLPNSVGAVSQEKDVIRELAWSPDGKLLASGSDRGQVSLWDANGKAVKQFPIQQENINRILWSPKNQFLLSWSTDDRALLWTIDGKLLAVFQDCSWTNWQAIQWSPDGEWLAVSPDNTILQIWKTTVDYQGILRTSLGVEEAGHDMDLRLAWSPDGKLLAAGNSRTNTVYIWDVEKGAFYWAITRKGVEALGALTVLEDPKLDHPASVERLAWSADSKVLAIGYYGWRFQLWHKGAALQTLVNRATNKDIQFDNVELAWSPDGKLLAYGDRPMSNPDVVYTRIWSADGRPVATIPGGEGVVMGLGWSPKQVLAIAYRSTSRLDLWSQGQKLRSAQSTFDSSAWGTPTWSFDGAYLAMAFIIARGYAVPIQIWTAEGTPVTVLNDGTEESQPFAW